MKQDNVLCTSILTFLALIVSLQRSTVTANEPSQLVFDLPSSRDNNDTVAVEDLLARGSRVPLDCMDQVDLELVPGISSVTAERILKQKTNLLKRGRDLPAEETLQIVYGIGLTKSRAIARYISLDMLCPDVRSRLRSQ
jgi:hypothetical protein